MLKTVIIRPIITEKSSLIGAHNKYVFQVAADANKIEIRQAIESIFNVKVAAVHTLNVKPRKKRVGRSIGKTGGWKKAMISLQEGHKIGNFEKLV